MLGQLTIATAFCGYHLLPKQCPLTAQGPFVSQSRSHVAIKPCDIHTIFQNRCSNPVQYSSSLLVLGSESRKDSTDGSNVAASQIDKRRSKSAVARRYETSATRNRYSRNDQNRKKDSNWAPPQQRKLTRLEDENRKLQIKRLKGKFNRKLSILLEKDSNGVTITQTMCDSVMGLCVAANECDEKMSQILDLMKKHNLKQERSTYCACLQECFEAGNGIAALDTLSAMEKDFVKHDTGDVRLAILALCRNNKYEDGLWEKAYKLLLRTTKSISSIEENGVIAVDAYNAILGCMEKEKRYQDALKVLNLMEQGLDNPDEIPLHPKPNLLTYDAALNTLSIAGQSEQALQLILSMPKKGIIPTIHTFEIVLSILLKRNNQQWRRAVELLDTMDDLKIRPSTVIYNRVISACSNAREVGSAMSLLTKMKNRKIEPDTVTYNALISACASTGRWKDSLRLLDECHRQPSIEPDIITYTNAMKACARAKMTGRALQLLDAAKEKKLPLDAYVYTTVIGACSKGKMWRKALELLDEMKENGITPNGYTYSAAIAACGNGSQWEKALDLLNQMREKQMKISLITYNSAITALAKASRNNVRCSTRTFVPANLNYGTPRNIEGGIDEAHLWRRALGLLKQMKEERIWPDEYSYSAAISACGSGGRFQEALDLIKTMRAGGSKLRPNKIAYTGAISACARSGEWAPALQLFIDMKADGIQCDLVAYNALISAFSVGCQPEMAYEIWNEMCGKKKDDEMKVLKNNEIAPVNILPDIITLTSVIAALERSKGKENIARMDEVFTDAVERQIILPEDSMDTAFEIDLSGMSLPVAKAACRFILRRLLGNARNGEECEDLMLITGVGKNHPQAGNWKEDDQSDNLQTPDEVNETGSSNESHMPKKTIGTTALREYVRQILRDDFDPPLYSVIQSTAAGVVQVKKEVLKKWIDVQNSR